MRPVIAPSTRTPPDGEVGELIEAVLALGRDYDQVCRRVSELAAQSRGEAAPEDGINAGAGTARLIADTLTAYRDKVERLTDALREIKDPISFMRDRADAEGACLNSAMALRLSDDPNYLKRIARSALTDPPNLPPGD